MVPINLPTSGSQIIPTLNSSNTRVIMDLPIINNRSLMDLPAITREVVKMSNKKGLVIVQAYRVNMISMLEKETEGSLVLVHSITREHILGNSRDLKALTTGTDLKKLKDIARVIKVLNQILNKIETKYL